MKLSELRSPSGSTRSSSASPHRGPRPQNHGSASLADVPIPGSISSSWCLKIRAQEAEQERLRVAEEEKKMVVKARAQDKIVIETSANEKTESANKLCIALHLCPLSQIDRFR